MTPSPCSQNQTFACKALWRLAALLWCGGGSVMSAEPLETPSPNPIAWNVRQWRIESGVPHNGVERLFVARNGWLWIGTRDGLARFDGVKFTAFNGQSPGFTSDAILDIAEDGMGDLWIATKRGVYRKRGGEFTRFTAKDGLGHDHVSDLFSSPDGVVWMATQNGLTRLHNARFQNLRLNEPATAAETGSQPNRPLFAVFCDRNGNIWAGAEDGLFRLNAEESKLEFVWRDDLPQAAGEGGAIRAIHEDRLGDLWFGSDLALARKRGGSITRFPFPDAAGDIRLRRITESASGEIHAVRAGEIYRLSTNGLTRVSVAGRVDHYYATDATGDDGKGFWAGTRHGGLFRLRRSPIKTFTTQDGLANNVVLSVCPGRDGSLWVGTARGLQRFHQGNFDTPKASPPYPWHPSLAEFDPSRAAIRPLLVDSSGALWISAVRARGEGLLWLQTNGPGFSIPPLASLGIPLSIVEDRLRRLWVATTQGILCLETNQLWLDKALPNGADFLRQRADRWYYGNTRIALDRGLDLWEWASGSASGVRFKRANEPEQIIASSLSGSNSFPRPPIPLEVRLPRYDVAAILEDRSGGIWFADRGGGVSVLRNEGLECAIPAQNELEKETQWLHEDQAGRIWVGTSRGLLRIVPGVVATPREPAEPRDKKSNPPETPHPAPGRLKLAALTSRNGLPPHPIHNFLEDHLGNYWIGSRAGLFRVDVRLLNDAADGRAEQVSGLMLDERDGLLTTDLQNGAHSACVTPDGKLWFATTHGLVRLDPTLVVLRERPPPVFIERLRAGDFQIQLLDPPVSPPAQPGLRRPSPDSPPAPSRPLLLPPGSGRSLELEFTALDYDAPGKLALRYRLEGHDKSFIDPQGRRAVHYSGLKPGAFRFQVVALDGSGSRQGQDAALAFVIPPAWHETWTARSCAVIAAPLAALLAYRARIRRVLRNQRTEFINVMHDTLAGKLSAIAKAADAHVLNQTSDFSLATPEPPPGIPQLARSALRSLRQACAFNQPGGGALEDLVTQLILLAEETFPAVGIAYRLDIPLDIPRRTVPPRVFQQVILIANEAVNNILKHANATLAQIRVRFDQENLKIEIEDNGRGFCSNPDASPRDRGLAHMRERAAIINADLRIRPAPGGGVLVALSLSAAALDNGLL